MQCVSSHCEAGFPASPSLPCVELQGVRECDSHSICKVRRLWCAYMQVKMSDLTKNRQIMMPWKFERSIRSSSSQLMMRNPERLTEDRF